MASTSAGCSPLTAQAWAASAQNLAHCRQYQWVLTLDHGLQVLSVMQAFRVWVLFWLAFDRVAVTS